MAKVVYFGKKARDGIRMGVNLIADAVKSTLGPRGRYVGIAKSYGTQHLTKDGVTVAKEVESRNPLADFAIKVIREASSKTADQAGDGTTTATVLAQSIYESSLKYIESGANPVSIQRGLHKVAEQVKSYIASKAHKVDAGDIDQLTRVATISANNDPEMGEKIAQVVSKVGKEGVVTVEEYQGMGIFVEYVEGMQIDRGYISPYFVTDSSRMEAVIEEPYVLVTDQKISSIKTILPIIEKVMEAGSKNLVIVADDVDGECLTNLVVNKLRGVLNVCAVKAPGFGDRKEELLQDIAVLTGANVISEKLGRSLNDTVSLDDLGRVRRFIANKDNSTFVEGRGDKRSIEERINMIRSAIANTTSEYDREKLQERLAKLTGGVAVIKVGAPTEVEMKEIKDRMDDAIQATKAALDGGIVAGGGVAYLNGINGIRTDDLVGDEVYAADIMRKALKEPILQILRNAGYESPEQTVAECMKMGEGYGCNALTLENGIDMVSHGIIDPYKVVYEVIENAVSVASQLSATSVVIVDVKEEKKGGTDSDMGEGFDDDGEI